MAEPAEVLKDEIPWPDISHLKIEDDTPVDNILSEMQMRLLAESLYASWQGPGEGRPFKVFANVGLFSSLVVNPLVPDIMVSLDVTLTDLSEKRRRSYFVWEFGKPPEVVVEIVSNREGGEMEKLDRYARIGVAYVAVYDPDGFLSSRPLRVYVRHGSQYVEMAHVIPAWLEEIELGLASWEGEFEGTRATWLRWCDQEGRVLLTGEERARQADQKAETERLRADRLAARLRELGIEE